ncbi:MAG: DivIVA domain-containing protein [Thermodesulfobacteriota bacterium]
MKVTSLEIRSHQLKKSLRGYDVGEVEALKELAADGLEDASREINSLEERLRDANERLAEHIANENMLRDTITTAQRMVEDMKLGARKEAELIIAEARLQAEEIVRQAHTRSKELQEDIFRFKKQRAEIETQIKAILNYHSTTLLLEEAESERADEEAEKLKFFPKP